MNFDLSQSISILERTPEILNIFLSDLPSEWVQVNEGLDTWSAYDIIGHLIHGEKTDWIVRSKIILSQDQNKKFDSFDRFAQFKNSAGKSINELLSEFKELRRHNINELKLLNLTKFDLQLEGIHPELGTVTLKQLLATWVAHDLGHIAQISRVMAKQYKSEVGPWLVYMNVLRK